MYIQALMELGLDPIREVSSFQRLLCTSFNGVGTRRCVPIREVSSVQELHKRMFVRAKCVLFIEVSSFQCVFEFLVYTYIVHVHV